MKLVIGDFNTLFQSTGTGSFLFAPQLYRLWGSILFSKGYQELIPQKNLPERGAKCSHQIPI
jgi:hypothetical protein